MRTRICFDVSINSEYKLPETTEVSKQKVQQQPQQVSQLHMNAFAFVTTLYTVKAILRKRRKSGLSETASS